MSSHAWREEPTVADTTPERTAPERRAKLREWWKGDPIWGGPAVAILDEMERAEKRIEELEAALDEHHHVTTCRFCGALDTEAKP